MQEVIDKLLEEKEAMWKMVKMLEEDSDKKRIAIHENNKLVRKYTDKFVMYQNAASKLSEEV